MSITDSNGRIQAVRSSFEDEEFRLENLVKLAKDVDEDPMAKNFLKEVASTPWYMTLPVIKYFSPYTSEMVKYAKKHKPL